MISIIIIIAIVAFAPWAVVGLGIGVEKLANRNKEPKAIEPGITKFDAHYARELEIETGLRATVQCDDDTCTKCYWIPRKRAYAEPKFYGNLGNHLNYRREQFFNQLPSGLSDELYDMMYADFMEELKPELDGIYKRKLERQYATTYDKIRQYQSEGRHYDKATNTWSEAFTVDLAIEKLKRKNQGSQDGRRN